MVRHHESLVNFDGWRSLLQCHGNLEDESVTELELYRKDFQRCETVDLAQNKFTHDALRYILPHCLQFSGLEVLKLYKNEIGDAGAELLADFVEKSPALRELHLSHNRIKAHGAVVIVHAADRSRTNARSPLWLRLERNAVEHAGDIAEALQEKLSVCLRLDRHACKQAYCANHCKVHLPFFLLQFEMTGNDHGIPWESEMDFEPAKRPRLEKNDAMTSFETSESESFGNEQFPPTPGPAAIGFTLPPAEDLTKVRLLNRHIGAYPSSWQNCKQSTSSASTASTSSTASAPRPTSAAGAVFAATTLKNVLSNPGRRSNRKPPEEKAEFPPLPLPGELLNPSPRARPSCCKGLEPPEPKPPVNLLSRQAVESRSIKGPFSVQAQEAMKAKAAELQAYQTYLEARERFMNLCEDIPTPDAAIDTESTASEESDVQIVKEDSRQVLWQSRKR